MTKLNGWKWTLSLINFVRNTVETPEDCFSGTTRILECTQRNPTQKLDKAKVHGESQVWLLPNPIREHLGVSEGLTYI
jgi:hypothetical protein